MAMNLMTAEQQKEWADLEERHTHSDTMAFSALEYSHMLEYRALADRLAFESGKESQL